MQTLTTNANSMLQTKKALLPVQYVASDGQDKEDILWITEMERYESTLIIVTTIIIIIIIITNFIKISSENLFTNNNNI